MIEDRLKQIRDERLEIRAVIFGLGVNLDFALKDLSEIFFERKKEFNIDEYKRKFSLYLNGGIDSEVERIIKDYSYIFIAYSNLDKLIRNRRFNK